MTLKELNISYFVMNAISKKNTLNVSIVYCLGIGFKCSEFYIDNNIYS